MITYYFTKPLQGSIFRKLRDMIMGNTDIALSTEQVSVSINQSKGITAVRTQQESRSVLGKEVEINSSPPPNKILHNGEPQADGPTCEPVCAGAHTYTPICASASARDPGMYEPYISPYDKGKHTEKATPAPSWDDVARRGQTSDIKGISDPHSFYKIQSRQVFIRNLYEYS
jgi:hypothetical protein